MSKKNESKSESWIYILGANLVLTAIISIFIFKLMSGTPEQKIVYFDMQALSEAKLKSIKIDETASFEKKQLVGEFAAEKFAIKVMEAVNAYEKNGYVVLMRGQIIGGPKGLDITNEIAEFADIKLDYKPMHAREMIVDKFKRKKL